jgi:hypothetical protein
MYDFFKTDISVAFEDRNNAGKMLPISQYSILHENEFSTLSNINFEVLLPSFQKAEHHYETFSRANWFLLELLNAYDKAEGTRKEKILKACKGFSDWISEDPEDELDYQIKTLNKLQTIKDGEILILMKLVPCMRWLKTRIHEKTVLSELICF